MTIDGFSDVCAFGDIPNGGRRVFDIRGVQVLCVRIDSSVAAVVNECTHLGHALDRGRLIGHQISCPSHGACFDLITGRALSGPAVTPLKVLPARIEQGRVLIAIEQLP